MEDQTRRLVIMRHAKAEQLGDTDAARELAPRGRRDAGAAGAWLAGQGLVPDHVLVSAVVRARQTWAAVTEGASWQVEATFDEGLYAAGPELALDLVRAVPPTAQTLLVIGHNPTMAQLAQMLEDGEGDAEAGNQMALGFPTSAVAVFEYDGAWADLELTSARLVAFHATRA
ncbi:MAG: SixA phosphatase family protein [Nocardioides sp.]